MTKPTKPRAKVRKPRMPSRLQHDDFDVQIWQTIEDDVASIAMDSVSGQLDAKSARRLAAWLLKAADYLDAKEKGGG